MVRYSKPPTLLHDVVDDVSAVVELLDPSGDLIATLTMRQS